MTLEREIAAFNQMLPTLERHHMGKFVVIKDDELTGAFDSLDAAATFAVTRYGRGPYLIRQVGSPPVHLPASVLYRPIDGGFPWTVNAGH